MIFNMEGGSSKTLPQFTYTGSYEILRNNGTDWAVALTSAGTLTVNARRYVDAFLVASGNKGGDGYDISGNGGRGGNWKVAEYFSLERGTEYPVSIAAVTVPAASVATTAFGFTTDDGNAGGIGGARNNGKVGGDGVPCFDEDDTNLFLDSEGNPKLFCAGGGLGYDNNDTGHGTQSAYAGGATGGGHGQSDSYSQAAAAGSFYGAGGGGGRFWYGGGTAGAKGYQGIVVIRSAR